MTMADRLTPPAGPSRDVSPERAAARARLTGAPPADDRDSREDADDVSTRETLREHVSPHVLWSLIEALANLPLVMLDEHAYGCLCCSGYVLDRDFALPDLDTQRQYLHAVTLMRHRHSSVCPVGHAIAVVDQRQREGAHTSYGPTTPPTTPPTPTSRYRS